MKILFDLLGIAVIGIAVGVVTLTLTKATIFEGLRESIKRKSAFFGELCSCPYCTSHWLALVALLICRTPLRISNMLLIDYGLSILTVIFISALTAGLIYRSLKPME
jgi:hypothetical protein